MKTATCNLCLQIRPLLAKSHIVPAFMYSGMRNSINQMLSRTLTAQPGRESLVQAGIFDKSILCENCDNVIIGTLERYASSVLYGGSLAHLQMDNGTSPDGIKHTRVRGIDYKKFKLFLLSIIWRAHLSKQKLFKEFDLLNDSEKLRKIILNSTLVDETEYKTAIFGITINHSELARMIVTPLHIKAEGIDFCSFIINGFMYSFNFQKTDNPSFFEKCFLKNIGEIEIPILNPEQSQILLKSYFKIKPRLLD